VTGSVGAGDVGSGGGVSFVDRSSDDLDSDDDCMSRRLSVAPVTSPRDNVDASVSITN